MLNISDRASVDLIWYSIDTESVALGDHQVIYIYIYIYIQIGTY